MPKAKRIAAGEPTRSPAPAAIDLAVFAPPPNGLPRKKLPPLEDDVAIEWGETKPDEVIAAFRKEHSWVKPRDLAEEFVKWRTTVTNSAPTTPAGLVAIAPDEMLLEILAMPAKCFVFWGEDDVDFVLARLGKRAVPLLRELHVARTVADTSMLRMVSPYAAIVAASNLRSYVSDRVIHHEWLLAHPEIATKALLHQVLTDTDDWKRSHACDGLRFLAAQDGGKLLRVAARVWDVTDLDAIMLPYVTPPQPAKIPKVWGPMPSPLDSKGMEKLLAFLASEPPASHPYTQRVLAAIDPGALRVFVSAMIHAWTSRGSASTHLWLVHADALVFGDAGARRIGVWARTKSTSPHRNERNRAGRALEVLDRFDTAVATAQIADAAMLAKAEWLREKAERSLRVRMLTIQEDLDDILERAMPDLGLGAGIVLDYGPRKFTAKARTDLSLILMDDTGGAIDELPRPRKSDDAKLAKAATESWRELRAEVDAVAKAARGRLETAMRTGRPWTRERFRAHVVGHPLMRMLAQGLVWGVRQGSELATFRVAEDGSLADTGDRAFDLPDAPITIVHPCEIDAKERAAWAARFQEYEVLPPIDQLGRVAFDVAPANVVEACAGWPISPGAIFGLLRDGWKPIYEDGATIGVVRSLGDDRKASVLFSPGIVLKEADASEKLKLHALQLNDHFRAHARARVDLSEVLRDLAGHRNPSMTSSASS
jgi:hypothetical protein